MAREQQKDLAQKFIDAQGKWDTDGMGATLAEDAKHDLLPASLGVGQKDNAGKIETTKKLAGALNNKPVDVCCPNLPCGSSPVARIRMQC